MREGLQEVYLNNNLSLSQIRDRGEGYLTPIFNCVY